eukprot:2944809-Karenia_brevis.AAC.1
MVLGNRGGRPVAKDCVEPSWLITTLTNQVQDNGRQWFNVSCYDSTFKAGMTPDLMALASAEPWLSIFLDARAYPGA